MLHCGASKKRPKTLFSNALSPLAACVDERRLILYNTDLGCDR